MEGRGGDIFQSDLVYNEMLGWQMSIHLVGMRLKNVGHLKKYFGWLINIGLM